MEPLRAKLTSKYQATVPKEVREVLNLEKGDNLEYEIVDEHTVILRRAYPLDFSFYEAMNTTLSEWESEDDEKAFKDL